MAKFNDISYKEKIGLAVSGGMDSCYLMHRYAFQSNIVVLTVDHALRLESAFEAEWVVQQANQLGLEAYVLTNTQPKPKAALQNTARNWRYDLLSKAAKVHNLSCILLAHHSNDQAETVLSRLMHDSGYAGLCGMNQSFYYDDVLFMRPLLSVSRAEIFETMQHKEYIHDPSNDNIQFERVRNRQFLQETPELVTHLLQLSNKAKAYYYPLLLERNAFLKSYTTFSPYGFCQIPRPVFDAQRWELQQEILKYAIKYATGNGYIKAIPALTGKNFTLSNAEICFNKRLISVYRENRNVPEFDTKRFIAADKPLPEAEIPFKARQTLPSEGMPFIYRPYGLHYFVSGYDREVI